MTHLSDDKLIKLKNEVPKLVGARIKEVRLSKGLTQTELAEKVGKDRQYLYKIEKGKVTPNIVTISAIALALKIELSELLDFKV